MKKVLKMGGYVRVSHEEQKKFGYSIKAQIQEIENWCKNNQYQLYKLYIDEGYSASNMKRPQLQAMLDDLPKLDIIVFTRLDRLSRNVFEANKMLDLFIRNNTDIIAINEEHIDTTTSNGMLMFNLKLTLAQHELLRGSERIKAVFEYKVKEGQPVTGSLPMGYKIIQENGLKKIVKDEKTEPIVNEIFEHFKNHHSMRATCIYINKKYGLTKDYKTYTRILKRDFYTGKYKSNPNYAPAYITEEQYILNQQYIKSNIRVRETKNIYLFTGIIKCPVCGFSFIGKYHDNKVRCFSYVCSRHKRNKVCSFNKSIAETKIEKYLLDNIEELVEKDVDRIATNAENKAIPEKDKVKKRIKEIKSELENLTYVFRKGRISLKQYDLEYEELENELKKLNSLLIPNSDIAAIKKFFNSNWRELYDSLEKDKKRAIWLNYIERIVLDENLNVIDVILKYGPN